MVLIEDEGHMDMNDKSNTQDTLAKEELPKSEPSENQMSVPLLQWSDSSWWFHHVHREFNLIELNRGRSFLSFTRADSFKMFQLPLWLVRFDSPVLPLLLSIIFRLPACSSMHFSCYHVAINDRFLFSKGLIIATSRKHPAPYHRRTTRCT